MVTLFKTRGTRTAHACTLIGTSILFRVQVKNNVFYSCLYTLLPTVPLCMLTVLDPELDVDPEFDLDVDVNLGLDPITPERVYGYLQSKLIQGYITHMDQDMVLIQPGASRQTFTGDLISQIHYSVRIPGQDIPALMDHYQQTGRDRTQYTHMLRILCRRPSRPPHVAPHTYAAVYILTPRRHKQLFNIHSWTELKTIIDRVCRYKYWQPYLIDNQINEHTPLPAP